MNNNTETIAETHQAIQWEGLDYYWGEYLVRLDFVCHAVDDDGLVWSKDETDSKASINDDYMITAVCSSCGEFEIEAPEEILSPAIYNLEHTS